MCRPEITKLKYGSTNTYFVQGGLLVDTDYAGTLPKFFGEIKKNGIAVSGISYVLSTHYHPDHMGLVSELADMGVKLLLLDVQQQYVHFSDEIFGRDKRLKYKPIDERKATMISCGESRKNLSAMGIEGEIISTPSHSRDSVSLILDSGICIAGDLEPIDYIGAYESNEALKADWERITSFGVHTVYYGHANEKILYK